MNTMLMKTLMDNRLLHSEPGQSGTSSTPPAASEAPVDVSVVNEPSVDIPADVDQSADFAKLATEFESDPDVGADDLEPAEITPPATPAPLPSAAPAAAPATPAVPIPAVPPAPPVVAPTTAAAPPAQAPAAPVVPVPPAAPTTEAITPERIEAAYKQYEATILPQLEAQYKLTLEQETLLNENPGQLIPKLMAQAHYRAQVAAYTGVMSQVPRIVSSVIEKYREVEKAENAFFDRWPLLKDSKHVSAVEQGLNAWRGANKGATTEDMIERGGLMIMLSLGLNPQEVAQVVPPVIPQTPARPAGTAGAGAARPANGGTGNPFMDMANDMLQEDI